MPDARPALTTLSRLLPLLAAGCTLPPWVHSADTFPLWLEVSARKPAAGVDVDTVPAVAAAVRQLWASSCTHLTLLDVNPVVQTARPLEAQVESRLVMDGRNAHLR